MRSLGIRHLAIGPWLLAAPGRNGNPTVIYINTEYISIWEWLSRGIFAGGALFQFRNRKLSEPAEGVLRARLRGAWQTWWT